MYENFETPGEVVQVLLSALSVVSRFDGMGQAGEATLGSESFVGPQ